MEYSTGQVACAMGVHANTVRMYEQEGLIAPARRLENGYRRFGEEHLVQFSIARCAFRAEILQNGLRKDAVRIARAAGAREYEKAHELCAAYIKKLSDESRKADDAARIAEQLLAGDTMPDVGRAARFLKRKEAAFELGVSIDVLRNWEANGLLSVKRSKNGYRIYAPDDMDRLRVIRALRCANYSIASILRLMVALDRGICANVGDVLDARGWDGDVVRACDHLREAIASARQDAQEILTPIEQARILAAKKACSPALDYCRGENSHENPPLTHQTC